MTQEQLTKTDAIAALRWYQEIGVTDPVAEMPSDFRSADFPAAAKFLQGEQEAEMPPQDLQSPAPVQDTAPSPISGYDAAPAVAAEPAAQPLGTAEASLDARRLAGEANSLKELEDALNGFEGCALKRTATNTVFADGNPQAKIMLVGEAPGADEDRLGKPFVGVSGKLLDKMLAAIGLDRETVYITNIVNWRPPGNRAPSASEIAVCLPFTRRHIELVNPDILLFVGGVAAKALLETSQGITRLRGRWTDYKSEGLEKAVPAMAIFHPAFLLRSPMQKKLAWQDLLAVKKRLAERQG
ncbi:MAG: uracil-DNA glycosylase [Pseudomonadota bacterium]|nr:uracil-DNA glycosylase [Pseudomonadota bacterium]QKK05722.1 MAG: uracil-DNA glycosylase [Pseudomonadota bacterium]